MAAQLGASTDLNQRFPCPLPGHVGDASFWLDSKYATWRLRCWCEGEWLRLSQVRAVRADRPRVVSKLEEAVWYLRLFHEARLITPIPVKLPPTPGGPPCVGIVREGFALLVGLRWLRFPGQPVGFEKHFAAAWCGVSAKQAYASFRFLRESGAVRQEGAHGRLHLYLPASEGGSP